MTPIQLFLTSFVVYFIFITLSDKEVLKKIDSNIAELFILLILFLSIISLIESVFWRIFYYVKV